MADSLERIVAGLGGGSIRGSKSPARTSNLPRIILFVGGSGTGKTVAARAIASQLGADLHRIDLSRIASKYIRETEKNIDRVFDDAENSGAVLQFDEADALFGKRSEVSDAHDQYANLEVSYLLQRMEAYSGPVILTTNRKDAIDTAFLRRLRHRGLPSAASNVIFTKPRRS